ncbi:MAG: APC family permease, partial [Mariprofundaceae bacterium]|nr:APC family permease [Mariprofundaceae bacterium]
VLGMAVDITGHAAPLAFALGGLLAFVAGYSYVRLALAYHSDGASFTYLEIAFPRHIRIAAITGWMVIVGYIGTIALYAFTFGAYGADLFGYSGSVPVRHMLSLGVILMFLFINLRGVKFAGSIEDIVVYGKIVLLAVLAFAGAHVVQPERFSPLLDHGVVSVFMAGALIFVAYEGFQLITNSVCESKNPDRNIPLAIYGSIGIVLLIYTVLAIVAVGSMDVGTLVQAEEYALAVAAGPVMGEWGPVLVDVAALLATASAINATMFGASRMMAEMAKEHEMPRPFSFRNRGDVPWAAVCTITLLSLMFTLLGGLELIAAFSSMTFLLVSTAVGVANLRLRSKTGANVPFVVMGVVLLLVTMMTLLIYLIEHDLPTLIWMGAIYLTIIVAEIGFTGRAGKGAS